MEPIHKKERVVVGISGGVDSSVAAWRLKEQGFDVIGLFMKNWEEDDLSYCNAQEDLESATESCETIGIPLKTVNFSYEYWEKVFAVFLQEYQKGHTPNPDVLCNREIKFREFFDFAKHLGAKFIATGHYARTRKKGSLTQLLKGTDPNKDQSYFLYQIPQNALARTLFPVGDLQKTEVRDIARDTGLPNSERKDSMGICFIGQRRFKDFLSRYLPQNTGEIKTLDGLIVGEHDGLWFYTIGQRHGLNIGGPGEAWYVARKDMSRNALYVVQGHDDIALMKKNVHCIEPHWITGDAPERVMINCFAKIRHGQGDQRCRLSYQDNQVRVRFDNAQRAITPGQSLVLYNGEIVLGGAIISASDNAASVT